MKDIFASDDGKTPKGIKTHITGYWLNIDNPEDKKAYEKIKAERKQSGGAKLFDCIDGAKNPSAGGDNSPVTLKTAHIFNNQWNTTDGRRVFDWYESINWNNRKIKVGHYLTITPEMIAIRKETFYCGYCGKNYHGLHNADKFCAECLGSEYLKEGDINLLRVMPCNWDGQRDELTTEEADILLPLYVEKQTKDTTTRAMQRKAKIRANIIAEAEKDIAGATTERDGFLWMLDRNINTDNVIYYNHTGKFSVGWRSPLSEDVKKEFKKHMKGFPFPVEYK